MSLPTSSSIIMSGIPSLLNCPNVGALEKHTQECISVTHQNLPLFVLFGVDTHLSRALVLVVHAIFSLSVSSSDTLESVWTSSDGEPLPWTTDTRFRESDLQTGDQKKPIIWWRLENEEREWRGFSPRRLLLIEWDESSLTVTFFLPAFLFRQCRF